jgi:endonuclease VIII
MPEGDTILRTARTLTKVLAGAALTGASSPLPQIAASSLVGLGVSRVEARGKNLLIHFDDARVLYTHMRMTGSWHVYRTGERWQKPERLARVVLENERFVAVCFSAPVVELLSARQVERHPVLAGLGPDVLSPGFDVDEACRRLRERPELSLGEAVMAQAAVAGIGNIYKSETLFLCRADPFARIADTSDPSLRRLLAKARELMSRNTQGAGRRTRNTLSTERYWVYRRAGRPCRRCAGEIRMRGQGTARRSTYWCPTCQAGGPAGIG